MMHFKKIRISPEVALIILLAGIKLAIHFFTNTNYELHRDAFLYLAQGDHIDFGYFSVPPSIAIIGNISRFLLGDSVFAVRFFPAIIGAASLVIISLLIKELGGGKWAIGIAGAAFILSPAFLRSNTLFQPVSFNQFYWLLSAYFFARMLRLKNPRYWIFLGITWGLAFMNKYSIVFFALALLISLVISRERNLFNSGYLLWGGLAGLIIILPNLLWQHHYHWPVLRHMAELQRTQLVNVNLAGFLLLQFLMNIHAVLIWLAGLFFLLFHPAARRFRVLGLSFLCLLFILMILRGKPYYTLGSYTMLFAAGGVAWEKIFAERGKFFKPAVIFLMAFLVIPVVPYSLPVLSPEKMVAYGRSADWLGLSEARRWEDGRLHDLPQDYADMTGWKELGDLVISAYRTLSEDEQRQCVIYAGNYGEAGAIQFYGRKWGLPKPVCFDDNFLLWAPDSAAMQVLIYVNSELGEDIVYFFQEIEEIGRIRAPFAREHGLPVFLCRNPKPGFAAYYREKRNRRQAELFR